tara:strand:- start:423 stop:1049 length:627 start_codon:yes stop_codon:yes gene_type:complete
MPLLLELFKGTGSAGKAFKGKVISVDNEKKYNPTIHTDILKLNYKDLPTPDYIWASPPCSSYTNMALTRAKVSRDGRNQRNTDTMKPLTPSAVLGDKLLKKTIEIIRYFSKMNPKLRWVMENPHGSMWKSPHMKKLPKYHTEKTLYCLYGDKRRKPTDFFSNVKLNLKEGNCGSKVDMAYLSLCDRYKIPKPLMTQIFKQLPTAQRVS